MKDKRKQSLLAVLLVIGLISITVGVTYAFFNYTRTGSSNVVSTGTINFNSSQNGRVNLTNIFPIDTTETGIMNDSTKVGTVSVTVAGDTSYDNGVEYLISAVNVNNTVGTKKIPISISATTSGTLGTNDDNYFSDRDNSNSHIYKVLAKNTISDGDQLMVGYIAKNTTGINGTIEIKAYIDRNNIAITDTPEANTEWQNGREVFSTTEWNSMQGTGVSFQIRVEANEGVWVIDRDRNDMKNYYSTNTFTSEQKSSITEINFIKATEDEINTHANLIDLTADGGHGIVKAWIENNKLYIASTGTTYFPENSQGLFSSFTNVTNINFNNINTSSATDMQGMFSNCSRLTLLNLSKFNTSSVTNMTALFNGCSNLSSIDLSSFNTSSVTNMQAMFYGCSNLQAIDLTNFNTSNIEYMNAMFQNCTNLRSVNLSGLGSDKLEGVYGAFIGCINLKNIDMSNFNFGNMTLIDTNYYIFRNLSSVETISLKNANASNISSLVGMFDKCSNLISIDLSGFNASNVINTSGMFADCGNLTTIYVSDTWNVENVTSSAGMFYNCTSLKGGGTPQTTFDSNHVDKEYARVDGGANSSTPGYLTLKTN